MFEIVSITEEQALKLLSHQESHFFDLKSRDIEPTKLTRTISAFCNSDGGDLYVGIVEVSGSRDKRKWEGFDSVEEANGHVQAFEEVSPFGEDMRAEFLHVEGRRGFVLHIDVKKSRFVRKASGGKVYKRMNAANLPVTDDEAITRLRRQKGLESFESETISVDNSVVTNSMAVISYLIEVVPSAEPDIYLKGQYLLANDKPTVAAILLFADEPQAILPKRCGVKIYRYRSEKADRDQLVGVPVTVEGDLYNQIYKSVSLTVEMIEQAAFLDEAGLRKVEYPQVALHEVIANAVIHRDYSVADDIHIRIFENRIEIESPGRLPGHITPENVLDERLSRNPFITRHLNRFPNPPNQDVGEGLNTAFDSMRKLSLREPVIEDRQNSTLVTIRHERLASPAQQVIEYLKTNAKIQNASARSLTGVASESRMKKIFEDLIKAKEIEHIPGTVGRAYAYRLGSKYSED